MGNISFYSITFRLFKLPGALEPSSEDYGHFVRYKVRVCECMGPSIGILRQRHHVAYPLVKGKAATVM